MDLGLKVCVGFHVGFESVIWQCRLGRPEFHQPKACGPRPTRAPRVKLLGLSHFWHVNSPLLPVARAYGVQVLV